MGAHDKYEASRAEVARLKAENDRMREALKRLLETIAPTPIIAETSGRLDGQSTFNVRFADIAAARAALEPSK